MSASEQPIKEIPHQITDETAAEAKIVEKLRYLNTSEIREGFERLFQQADREALQVSSYPMGTFKSFSFEDKDSGNIFVGTGAKTDRVNVSALAQTDNSSVTYSISAKPAECVGFRPEGLVKLPPADSLKGPSAAYAESENSYSAVSLDGDTGIKWGGYGNPDDRTEVLERIGAMIDYVTSLVAPSTDSSAHQ